MDKDMTQGGMASGQRRFELSGRASSLRKRQRPGAMRCLRGMIGHVIVFIEATEELVYREQALDEETPSISH